MPGKPTKSAVRLGFALRPRDTTLKRKASTSLDQNIHSQSENADRVTKARDNLPQTRLKHADSWLASKTKVFERRVAQLNARWPCIDSNSGEPRRKRSNVSAPASPIRRAAFILVHTLIMKRRTIRRPSSARAGYSRDIHGHIGALIAASSWLNATRRSVRGDGRLSCCGQSSRTCLTCQSPFASIPCSLRLTSKQSSLKRQLIGMRLFL